MVISQHKEFTVHAVGKCVRRTCQGLQQKSPRSIHVIVGARIGTFKMHDKTYNSFNYVYGLLYYYKKWRKNTQQSSIKMRLYRTYADILKQSPWHILLTWRSILSSRNNADWKWKISASVMIPLKKVISFHFQYHKTTVSRRARRLQWVFCTHD